LIAATLANQEACFGGLILIDLDYPILDVPGGKSSSRETVKSVAMAFQVSHRMCAAVVLGTKNDFVPDIPIQNGETNRFVGHWQLLLGAAVDDAFSGHQITLQARANRLRDKGMLGRQCQIAKGWAGIEFARDCYGGVLATFDNGDMRRSVKASLLSEKLTSAPANWGA
jgi:hypothetical protein